MSGFGQVPLDEFNKAFCVVCANRECQRSGSNNMSFDRRTSTWMETLFLNVPRADESDSQFSNIRSKMFVSTNQSSPERHVQVQVPRRFESVPQESPEQKLEPSPDPVVAPVPIQTSEVQTPPIQTPPVPSTVVQHNTPFVQGAVLPGGPAAPSSKVLQPGQTFTFDEDEL